ncbi:MAG: hypothetical protein LBR23_05750 [Spirochaetaceae bacterium]|jgi:hypothetical protein|nr:hypothetical protein [Spirochaetaceae bacterium]
MKKRILFTAALLILGVLSFGPVAARFSHSPGAEAGMQHTLTQKSAQILKVWAALKIINGVINVLQSAEIGLSIFAEASINPLEFLGPLDNILDKLSDLLLLALAAVAIEKLILAVSLAAIFKVIIPVCIILCVLTVWLKKDGAALGRVIPLFTLIALSLSAAVPLSFQTAQIVENRLLSRRVDGVLTGISEKEEAASVMEKDVTGLKKIGASIVSFLGTARDLGNALAEDFINYIIIFFVTNLLIPLATLCAMLAVTKYCARLILGG